MSISEFEFACGIDNQNLAKLGIYIQQSNIVHKVRHGQREKAAKNPFLFLTPKSFDMTRPRQSPMSVRNIV